MREFLLQLHFWIDYVNPRNDSPMWVSGRLHEAFWGLLSGLNE